MARTKSVSYIHLPTHSHDGFGVSITFMDVDCTPNNLCGIKFCVDHYDYICVSLFQSNNIIAGYVNPLTIMFFKLSILLSQLIICTFAADNVERFENRKVPDSLQPHKKMLKVTLTDSI